ncbi:MAG TPA: PHP-associated domain-containing protein [Vicinamibacterales bacterium]|jgi:predicted metal-dependent phosphoesterase TrpH
MTDEPRLLTVSRPLKADLHVHSFHSGFTSTLRMFRSLDCYSTPEEVYRRAKARGMDVVTITDHDSINGCLELLDRHPDAPDILVGEEIECRLPDTGIRVHLGAFGLSERIHRDVQPLCGDVREAAAFLRAHSVGLVLHHPFHFFRGEMPVGRYLEDLLPLVHAVEARNGTMLPGHNETVARLVAARAQLGLGQTGGSDAHVLSHVGDSYTNASGMKPEPMAGMALTPAAAFLDSLKRGETRAAGRHGTPGRFAFEIYGVVFNYWGGLLGLRRSGLSAGERLSGLGCSLVSLPFQFTPLLVSIAQKIGERRRVARWNRELETT